MVFTLRVRSSWNICSSVEPWIWNFQRSPLEPWVQVVEAELAETEPLCLYGHHCSLLCSDATLGHRASLQRWEDLPRLKNGNCLLSHSALSPQVCYLWFQLQSKSRNICLASLNIPHRLTLITVCYPNYYVISGCQSLVMSSVWIRLYHGCVCTGKSQLHSSAGVLAIYSSRKGGSTVPGFAIWQTTSDS